MKYHITKDSTLWEILRLRGSQCSWCRRGCVMFELFLIELQRRSSYLCRVKPRWLRGHLKRVKCIVNGSGDRYKEYSV